MWCHFTIISILFSLKPCLIDTCLCIKSIFVQVSLLVKLAINVCCLEQIVLFECLIYLTIELFVLFVSNTWHCCLDTSLILNSLDWRNILSTTVALNSIFIVAHLMWIWPIWVWWMLASSTLKDILKSIYLLVRWILLNWRVQLVNLNNIRFIWSIGCWNWGCILINLLGLRDCIIDCHFLSFIVFLFLYHFNLIHLITCSQLMRSICIILVLGCIKRFWWVCWSCPRISLTFTVTIAAPINRCLLEKLSIHLWNYSFDLLKFILFIQNDFK